MFVGIYSNFADYLIKFIGCHGFTQKAVCYIFAGILQSWVRDASSDAGLGHGDINVGIHRHRLLDNFKAVHQG